MGNGASVDGGAHGEWLFVLIEVVVLLDPVLEFGRLFGPFLFLVLGPLNEGMLQEVRPSELLGRVLAEQPFQKIFEMPGDSFWVDDWIFADVVDEGDEVGRSEGRSPSRQLV